MHSRRTFLISSSITASTLTAEETPTSRTQEKSEPGIDIFQAAFKGDIPRATELAGQNPWIAKLRSPDDRTPLHFAAAGGHPDMIMFLTAKGADLSAGPESPLLSAVDYPDHAVATEMAQLLLMNASDPNARSKDGKTALQLAESRGYTDISELLIHRGAEFSGAANVDRVYFGRRYSFDAQGKPFAPAGVNGLPQDFINQFVTFAHFDVERVKHLFQIAPGLLTARATWDELAIEAAAHMGLAPLAQFLSDQGSPVSTCTAAILGLKRRVETLVTSEPKCLHERGAHDIPLLVYTAYGEQRVDIAEFLLKSGADVHVKGLGMTTLHIAAFKGHVELAQLLLDHGADVNAPGKSRGAIVTPLAVAIRSKQPRMEQFLKDHGGRA